MSSPKAKRTSKENGDELMVQVSNLISNLDLKQQPGSSLVDDEMAQRSNANSPIKKHKALRHHIKGSSESVAEGAPKELTS